MRSPVKEEVVAVNGVSLQIAEGEIFGLLGPNGTGKTTLIKMLTTLLQPTSGSAKVAGYDVVSEEENVRHSIGLVTGEERSFYLRLTGRQNLAFFAGLCNIERSEIQKRVNDVLQKVTLSEAADNMFYSYSSGMKQKLSIARALLNDPRVLFLDEPTRSVDVVAIAEIKRFIKALVNNEQKRTVVFATHRLEEAEELCDRVAIMNKGRIIFCGTVSELRSVLGGRERYDIEIYKSGHDRCKIIQDKHSLANASIVSANGNGTIQLSFTVSKENNPISGVLNDILTSGGEIVSCEKKERRLEEMFIDIVKGDRN
jgi:ABC-2 type transport system ATP-binding protein